MIKVIINTTLHKSIDSFGKIVKLLGDMNKRKHDKVLRFIDELFVKIALLAIVICWAIGHFILGRPLW